MKPGVVRPWIDRSAAIEENAVPITTERASPRRAPAIVSASAAVAASPALIAIGRKCTLPSIWTDGLAEEVDGGSGQHRARGKQREEGHGPLPEQTAHCVRYRTPEHIP